MSPPPPTPPPPPPVVAKKFVTNFVIIIISQAKKEDIIGMTSCLLLLDFLLLLLPGFLYIITNLHCQPLSRVPLSNIYIYITEPWLFCYCRTSEKSRRRDWGTDIEGLLRNVTTKMAEGFWLTEEPSYSTVRSSSSLLAITWELSAGALELDCILVQSW